MSETDGDVGRFRHLTGCFGLIEKILLIAIPIIGILFVLGLHIYLRQAFYRQQYMAIFLGLALASIFLGVPATRGASRYRLPWYDVLLAGMSLSMGLFICLTYPSYLITGIANAGREYLFFSVLGILLVIEASRRITGWVLVVLIGLGIFYALFTWLFPVPFYGNGISWEELAVYLLMDNNALLGMPLWAASSMIFAFILFGQFLLATGGSLLLTDFALATMGRFRGGPAKVSVVASSLFGTISGSAVANVMVDGWMTIPMMIKTGYKPEVAAAIEAAASTGGQLMPPVMGVTAFFIAEILTVPYSQVAIAAIIPAVFYYVSLFIGVDIEAVKSGMKGLSAGELPPIGPILKASWLFAIPLGVIVLTLFILDLDPGVSAIIAVASVFILSFLKKETQVGLRKLLSVLEGAGKGMLEIGAITAIAGFVIGTIFITGLGTIFSQILLSAGGKSVFLMLVYTAIVSLILGCGMPTGAVYIILAVLVAPALIQHGILPMAAHLFIFYFGAISMITPPVCLASYAAASIVGANQMKTGYHGVRLCIAGFVIPFIFVYSPSLILEGTILEIIITVIKTFFGIMFIAFSIRGFLFQRLNWTKSILLCLGATGLIFPLHAEIPIGIWLLNSGGAVLCFCILFWEYQKKRQGKILQVNSLMK